MLGVGTWIFAFVMAFYFADTVASALSGFIGDPALRVLTAYAGVFLVVLAIGAVLTSLLANWIRQTGLSAADRSLGGPGHGHRAAAGGDRRGRRGQGRAGDGRCRDRLLERR